MRKEGMKNEKRKVFLLSLIIIAIIFSILGSIYTTVKVSNILKESKISSKVIQANIQVCLDVAPPVMDPIGDLTAYINRSFAFKVNATSPSNRTIYFFDNTTLFDINISNGWINFTPTDQQFGGYSVRIWSTHNICGLNTSESILLTIETNHAPIWSDDTPVNQNVTEDSPYFLNLSPYVSDPDNDILYFFSNNSYSEFPSFNLTIQGILNFTADDIDVGVHAVKMNASDLQLYATKNFSFNVINVNEPPIMIPFPSEFDLCEDDVFYYMIDATDEDLNIPNSPEQLFFYDDSPMFVINEQNGEIIFIPEPEYAGHNPTRIYASDEEELGYQDTDFYIIPINDQPILDGISAKTVWVNETLNFIANAFDEEDGRNNDGNLTFTDNTDLFDINSTTGRVRFTPYDEQVGTYNISICVEDKGIPQPENYSLCGDYSYLPKISCQNFSLTVTLENRPPVITSYIPIDLKQEIEETESILFIITKEDPDGTIPTTYWFKNDELVNWTYDAWLFETTYGDAGFYVIKVEISDGLLNDSMEWNVTVNPKQPEEPPSGGGGGGGEVQCNEIWTCSDWFDCTNFSKIYLNLSEKSKEAWYDLWRTGCEERNIPLDICGIQIRYCKDMQNCSPLLKKLTDFVSCRLIPPPSCEDGIRNCHHGSCELLTDCGGPCNSCPQELTKIEYPRTNCGDNRCDLNEIFSCPDCLLFWLFCLALIILILAIIYILKKKKIIAITKKRERKKEEKIKKARENIKDIERDIQIRRLKDAKDLVKKTEKLLRNLDKKEAGILKNKLFNLKKELINPRRFAE